MAKATELSEVEAIKAVIAEGGAMDYIDVVDAVDKRFHIKTSSLKVEEVHRELVNSRTDLKESPKPKVTFAMASQLPSQRERERAVKEPGTAVGSGVASGDEVALALQFVQSVGGLSKAKQALAALEAVLRE